jgi:hypothetical protein
MALRKEELKSTLLKKAMDSEFQHILDDEEDDLFMSQGIRRINTKKAP